MLLYTIIVVPYINQASRNEWKFVLNCRCRIVSISLSNHRPSTLWISYTCTNTKAVKSTLNGKHVRLLVKYKNCAMEYSISYSVLLKRLTLDAHTKIYGHASNFFCYYTSKEWGKTTEAHILCECIWVLVLETLQLSCSQEN